MIIKSLEDLQIYKQAVDAADAISAILKRSCFQGDPSLRDQMLDSSAGVPSHISEGYGQRTDRHFCHYLGLARGSCNEIRTQLGVAKGRKYITDTERTELCERYIRIGKGATRLMQHLRREDRKERN